VFESEAPSTHKHRLRVRTDPAANNLVRNTSKVATHRQTRAGQVDVIAVKTSHLGEYQAPTTMRSCVAEMQSLSLCRPAIEGSQHQRTCGAMSRAGSPSAVYPSHLPARSPLTTSRPAGGVLQVGVGGGTSRMSIGFGASENDPNHQTAARTAQGVGRRLWCSGDMLVVRKWWYI